MSAVHVQASLLSPSVLSPHFTLVSLEAGPNVHFEQQNFDYAPFPQTQDNKINEFMKLTLQAEVVLWWQSGNSLRSYSLCQKFYLQCQEEYLDKPNKGTFRLVQDIAIKILLYWFEIDFDPEMKKKLPIELLSEINKVDLQLGRKNIPLLIFLTSANFLSRGLNKEREIFTPRDWQPYLEDFPTFPNFYKQGHGKPLYNISNRYEVVLSDMIDVVAHNTGTFLYNPTEETLQYTQKNLLLLESFSRWQKGKPKGLFTTVLNATHQKNLDIASTLIKTFNFLVMPPLHCESKKDKKVNYYLDHSEFYYTKFKNKPPQHYLPRIQELSQFQENQWRDKLNYENDWQHEEPIVIP